MKHFFLFLFSFALFYSSSAQKIENLSITQNKGELIFTYNLFGSSKDLFSINLFYSNNEKTWVKLDKVHGEIGDSISSGQNKKFVLWLDHLENVPKTISFKLVAQYYTIDQTAQGELRDNNGYTYKWARYGKNRWMTQNLRNTDHNNDCGGLYTNSEARNSCPDGWSLPSDNDWMELEIKFGVDKNKAKAHGLHEINFDELQNSGFNINECPYKTSFYVNQKALAFWSKSENKMLYTGYSNKYFARIIRLDEKKISKELRNKNEKMSVRCIQSATRLASIEATVEFEPYSSPTIGYANHPFSGEKIAWIYTAGNIWQKKDTRGSYLYKETKKKCPVGWKVPEKKDWEKLFNSIKPSIKTSNTAKAISQRLSTKGNWSINLSPNNYWMSIPYYTYNTFWISEKDKRDSKKRLPFPSNKKEEIQWLDRQTNEKAKVRCILEDKEYISIKNSIKTGEITDSRDNTKYQFVEIDNSIWLSENIRFDTEENCQCRGDVMANCKLFGKMYNIKVANQVCPSGWRIPSQKEWKHLLINKAANNLKKLYPFGETGFNLLLGGESIYDEEIKKNIYTAKYLFTKEGKFGYYYIDSNNKVEMHEKAKKKGYYYIRCIKK
ncbi:MAG: hypothetical protein MI739_12875 [Bacteroidales bacterium]|nr:hypothetical protein [Bacteroidales bacterium]